MWFGVRCVGVGVGVGVGDTGTSRVNSLFLLMKRSKMGRMFAVKSDVVLMIVLEEEELDASENTVFTTMDQGRY